MNGYERAVKLWRSWNVAAASDLDKYLHNFRILFAYHSGKIENEDITWHDTREIFENGRVTGFSGNPRALFEQQNQKLCYEYLKEKIAAKAPLDLCLVREVHRMLTAGTYDERRYVERGERPGNFKRHDYVAGIHEVGAAPEDAKREVAELLAEVNAYEGPDVLKAAAYFHAKFEHIHPFADGNGRVGRTLLNYYLMTRNHPPLIIGEEDRRQYFVALQKYDEDEDLEPLYRFLKAAVEKTWGRAAATADGEKQGRKGLKDFTG
ncbi:MAG: Fic family protein [Synergistaceae bacterium]|nr:Fic family protein [Synergistota bacterium]NLM72181.1 Fic family protein [Synergistaceae bacterium]